MKKVISLILALVMIMAMATTAFAADGTVITIEGSTGDANKKFTAYKVLDGSFGANGAVVYTISEGDDFYTAVNSIFTLEAVPGEPNNYYVTNGNNKTAAEIVPVLKDAVADDTPKYESTYSNGDYLINIPAGEEGYYLILGSDGTGVILDTVSGDTTLSPKEENPSIDKKIVVNGQEVDSAAVNVGDTVTFALHVSIPSDFPEAEPGTVGQSIIVHDIPDAGIQIQGGTARDAEGNHFPENTQNGDCQRQCPFQVTISNEYAVEHAGEDVVIYYDAKITDEIAFNKASLNKAWVTTTGYQSSDDEVKLYTYGFKLNKTGKDGAALTGAQFVLATTETLSIDPMTNRNEKVFFTVANGVYTVATANDVDITDTIYAGSVSIRGLGKGTYYLHETKAPDGYNKLDKPIVIEITDNGILVDGEAVEDGVTVTVINKTGSLLPSTGGIGTTLFYIFGAVMVLGAGVLLITNKRMRAI